MEKVGIVNVGPFKNIAAPPQYSWGTTPIYSHIARIFGQMRLGIASLLTPPANEARDAPSARSANGRQGVGAKPPANFKESGVTWCPEKLSEQ